MHDFSRALNKLRVMAGKSDWFIPLFDPVVFDRRNYFSTSTGFLQSFKNYSIQHKVNIKLTTTGN